MKYQRRKQKRTRTIVISPPVTDDLDRVIKQEPSDMLLVGVSEDEQSQEDAGLEHFLTRRVHPRKGTSKKLFPAHASK